MNLEIEIEIDERIELFMERQIINSTSLFEVDNDFNSEKYMKVRFTVMHSGINRNNSRFSLDTILNAKESFKNIPILAEIAEYTDENGDKHLDYTTHAMHIEEDAFNENEQRIIYDEKVVGIIPETNDFEIVHDDETGNDYVKVTGILFRDYGNYCCDILESRDGKTDVSAEISCYDCSFDAKDKCLDVGTMEMCAVTLLGDKVQPGMYKAHAEMFSSKIEEQKLEFMQDLKESLDKYIKISKEGGETQVDSEKNFEEVTENEVEEVAEETTDGITTEEDTVETPDDEVVEEAEVEPEVEVVEQEVEVPVIEQENTLKYSVESNGEVKDFSISLSDKIYALTTLVNETYGDVDNTWYDVNVYEEDKIIEMYSYWSNKAYRQSFKCKKDKYSLVGDRIEIFSKWLTQDEINALENMKANYSSISEKLQKYEEEPEKMEILNSAKYGYVSNTDEFVSLVNEHFDLSIEDVKTKANEILLSYAEKGELQFSANDTSEQEQVGVNHKTLPRISKGTSRYGNLF